MWKRKIDYLKIVDNTILICCKTDRYAHTHTHVNQLGNAFLVFWNRRLLNCSSLQYAFLVTSRFLTAICKRNACPITANKSGNHCHTHARARSHTDTELHPMQKQVQGGRETSDLEWRVLEKYGVVCRESLTISHYDQRRRRNVQRVERVGRLVQDRVSRDYENRCVLRAE